MGALDGWRLVAYTMDYHPHNHLSFAENRPFNKTPFESVDLEYDEAGRVCGKEYADIYSGSGNPDCKEGDTTKFSQTLWPVHCVQGTKGQELDEGLKFPDGAAVIKKGISSVADSYGVFEDNRVFYSEANLEGIEYEIASESNIDTLLQVQKVSNVYVVGVALDYCVRYSALQ